MRQSIGETATFNIIIIFIVIVFALLIGAVNYYKAFKVNARILDIIEKYEGYNNQAVEEIDNYLGTIGYRQGHIKCEDTSHGRGLATSENGGHGEDQNFDYCVYYFETDGEGHYNYSVMTFIYVDLPGLKALNNGHGIPVYTKGERTFRFTGTKNPIS